MVVDILETSLLLFCKNRPIDILSYFLSIFRCRPFIGINRNLTDASAFPFLLPKLRIQRRVRSGTDRWLQNSIKQSNRSNQNFLSDRVTRRWRKNKFLFQIFFVPPSTTISSHFKKMGCSL